MKNLTTKMLTRFGLVTALYVALTLALPEFSYGIIQFRVSELLNLLAFYNPMYLIPITLGCAISNLFSPFGIIDVIGGTLHTFLALYMMTKVNKDYIAGLFPAVFAPIIGAVIWITSGTEANFYLVSAQVALSELVICWMISVPFYRYLMKNSTLREYLLEGAS